MALTHDRHLLNAVLVVVSRVDRRVVEGVERLAQVNHGGHFSLALNVILEVNQIV